MVGTRTDRSLADIEQSDRHFVHTLNRRRQFGHAISENRNDIPWFRETDGLEQPWFGKVWLNPPYGLGDVSDFCERLIDHYQAGRVTEAIALVNNATETRWFGNLANAANAVCFKRGRIAFLDPTGKPRRDTLQGQCFVYLGPNTSRFCEVFADQGVIFATANQTTNKKTANPVVASLV